MPKAMTGIKEFLFSVPPKDHSETIPELRQRWFENIVAILLAVAAITATWSSFEAARWGGKGGGLVSSSSILRADSNREASRGAEQTLIDASLWLEWEKARSIPGRENLVTFLRDRFSPALDLAQDEWLKSVPVDAAGNPTGALPPLTPLNLDAYVPPGQKKSEDLAAQAETQLAESSTYGAISSRYVNLTVLFALVLFFGNVATKFGSPKLQLALGLLSTSVLLFGLLRLATLPLI
jgi:hypothetical protein